MILHIIPSTGTLTALTFNGALSGTALIATTVTLVETNTTDATHFPVFVDTATGSENPKNRHRFYLQSQTVVH